MSFVDNDVKPIGLFGLGVSNGLPYGPMPAVEIATTQASRRPRFRRATAPPAFYVTDGDIEIIQQIARHRFLRSTQVAALVGRSLDRTNDRLCRLFHAGFIDRPRGQLDHLPISGSAPMVYALADLGAQLLKERGGSKIANGECSRKNDDAGRPFIEHQLEITDFLVALQRGVQNRGGLRLISSDELIAAFPERTRSMRNPLALRVNLSHNGKTQEIGLIPDLIFGIGFPDGSRRCFMVEIDRGTMPISRAGLSQTSFERKMRAYLTAHASRQHEQQFAWRTFRVLTVTTDQQRVRSMIDALRQLHVPQNPGASLFFFAIRDDLRASDPLAHPWSEGTGRNIKLV